MGKLKTSLSLLEKGCQTVSLSEITKFVLKHKQKNSRDIISIMGADLKPFCTVRYDHSWKMPRIWNDVPTNRRMRTTDVRLEREDGELFREIHEIPTGTLRLIRKWEVSDEKGISKGVVTEKPKFVGSDWVLEDVEGNPLASVEGDRKKRNYEVITPYRYKQTIARCSSIDKDTYKLEVMISNVDSLLVLCYVIVLDLVKTPAVIKRREL
jgi:uncharacterized protein YxjI